MLDASRSVLLEKESEEVVNSLIVTLRQIGLYSLSHKTVKGCIDRSFSLLGNILSKRNNLGRLETTGPRRHAYH